MWNMCSRQTCPNTFSFYHKEFWTLELIFSDMYDSNRVLTQGGRRYFVIFIDDYSKFCYTYLLKSKDGVLNWFKVHKAEAKNQLERKIKILRFDCGREYTSNDMTGFCQEHTIFYKITAPYTIHWWNNLPHRGPDLAQMANLSDLGIGRIQLRMD